MGYTTNEEPALLLVVIPVAPTGEKKKFSADVATVLIVTVSKR